MKIIVLAGGEGKRMWPISTDKCLIPFLGKPLLYHNLKKLTQLQPDEVIIVSNSQSRDKISQIMADLGVKGTIVLQTKPLGMADAILSAKDLIEGEILVVNAEDIVEAQAFSELIKVSKGAEAAFV